MRVVFFGSPDYALPTLRGLLDAPDVEVVAAVTQPDRPRGRSGRAVATPVRRLGEDAGVPVLTPERIRREQTADIAAFEGDVGVLAASAHILPTHLLEAFPHGVLNVHASLLPRHRGASPVAAAILAGDTEAGATIMQIVRELDAGPVLGTVATPIDPLDTTATLTERIAELGARRLVELLGPWVAGEVEATPQDASLVTYAPTLVKSDGALDWSWPAEELWRRIRAMQPWPQATTTYGDAPFTIHAAWPVDAPSDAAPGEVHAGDGSALSDVLPGRVARAVVACGEGGLALLRVQRAGRRALEIE
ncbi:MAG: methionyl-tRNA formyltransferase, partial [Chloroflexi bacterium]|nr:methionyl-tRNA formyltransferase [Chloroflexota bacterium]